MRLFKIEFKRQIFSLIYVFFCILLILGLNKNFFGITQDEIKKAYGKTSTESFIELDRPLLKEPTVNDDFFGTKFVENPEKIMIGATDNLLSEYKRNTYATYPYGYYKAVSLSEKEQNRILEILCEITGLSEKELLNLPDGYFPTVNGTIVHIPKNDTAKNNINITVPDNESQNLNDKYKVFTPQISYQLFKNRMTEVEEIVGRGCAYEIDNLIKYYGIEEMTYEEAKEEFDTILKEDKLTGSFARLYCDVVSGIVGIIPAFIVVFLWMKDLTSRSSLLIYVRKVSSCKLVLSRYLTGVVLVILPVMLLTLESLIPLVKFAFENNYTIDYLAYIKYIFIWILPTIMIVMALSTLLTVLTDSPIVILIQLIWWFVDRGVTDLTGDTSFFTLMIRHNTLFELEAVKAQNEMILTNRLILIVLSFIFISITVFILNKKRSGKFELWGQYEKILAFIKRKFKISYC